jgi:glyoxylase-like metal-dependent hydrolase (beta-lactamase superfamily II)
MNSNPNRLHQPQQALSTRQFRLGDAVISVLCLGSIEVQLSTWFAPPPGGWPAAYAQDFERAVRLPVLCVHIALPWARILFDACDPHAYPPAQGQHPSLRQRLVSAGIDPAEISHVVISHGHHDHYCGLVETYSAAQPPRRAPTFPQARHFISRSEWAQGALCKAATDADGEFADGHMLQVLDQHGLLAFTTGEQQLVPGVHMIPAPGESPGHMALRIEAGSEPIYLLGDLYHHRVELDFPALTPIWADETANSASRAHLSQRILNDNGSFLCSHICPVLRPDSTGSIHESTITPVCGCAT